MRTAVILAAASVAVAKYHGGYASEESTTSVAEYTVSSMTSSEYPSGTPMPYDDDEDCEEEEIYEECEECDDEEEDCEEGDEHPTPATTPYSSASTMTMTTTKVYTVTSCAPEYTECPYGEVVTEVFTSTWCPDDYDQNDSTSTEWEYVTISACEGYEPGHCPYTTSHHYTPTTSAYVPDHTTTSAYVPDHTTTSAYVPDHTPCYGDHCYPAPEHSTASTWAPCHGDHCYPAPEHSTASTWAPCHGDHCYPAPEHSTASTWTPCYGDHCSPVPEHTSSSWTPCYGPGCGGGNHTSMYYPTSTSSYIPGLQTSTSTACSGAGCGGGVPAQEETSVPTTVYADGVDHVAASGIVAAVVAVAAALL